MRKPAWFLVLILQFALTPVRGAQHQLGREIQPGLSCILKFNGVGKDLNLSEEQNKQLMRLWVEIETHLDYAIQNYQANFAV